ncbi:MAG: LamG domain-containing protein, partial [Minisyncoccia bacterium]
TMTRGLVGYWNMDEGGGQTAIDSSGNSNNGTLGAAATSASDDPQWTRGAPCLAGASCGGGLKFDGVDDYASQPYDTDFNFGTGSFSVSGWFKHNTISAADYLVTRYSTAAGTPGGWKVYMDASGDIAFAIDDDATWDTADIAATSAIDYDDNQWYYFTAVKNGISSIKLYIDGSEAASDSSLVETGTLSGTTPVLYMGSDSPTAGSYWEGLIDEVRIYNRALSAEEVRYHYNRGGPVAEWKFDEGSGSVARDGTENNNDGTLVGATHLPTWTAGKYGSALTFDGAEDYVNAGNVYNGVKTVSFWMKGNNITQKILDLNGSAYIEVSSGVITATGWTTPVIYVDGKASSAVDTAWHHITITTATGINASAVNLGKVSTGYFSGILDDIRVYNYARAPLQIQQDYNAGLASYFK